MRCQQNHYGPNCEFHVTPQKCMEGDSDKTMCSQWKKGDYCDFKYTYNDTPIPIYCPVSCGLCQTAVIINTQSSNSYSSPPSSSSCVDSQTSCTQWAALGLCSVVNAQDPNLCRRSCGNCTKLIKKLE